MATLEYAGYRSTGLIRFNSSMIDKLKDERFSLIILDMTLEGFDSRELARILKTNQITQEISLILISAYPHLEYTTGAVVADGFVPKPFGVDELIQKVEQLL